MSERVIDASALVEALTGRSPEAVTLRRRLADTDCHAPHLIDAEVGNVLRRLNREAIITDAAAATALHALENVIDFRYPHLGALAESAWALRHNLTFYDALYVALARSLEIPLLTGDRRLAEAAKQTCATELI